MPRRLCRFASDYATGRSDFMVSKTSLNRLSDHRRGESRRATMHEHAPLPFGPDPPKAVAQRGSLARISARLEREQHGRSSIGMEPAMEVLLEREEQWGATMKREEENVSEPTVPSRAAVADQKGRVLTDPRAAVAKAIGGRPGDLCPVEREVHDQAWRSADLYVAALLAKASEHPNMARHAK